jgi:hypothetical protein
METARLPFVAQRRHGREVLNSIFARDQMYAGRIVGKCKLTIRLILRPHRNGTYGSAAESLGPRVMVNLRSN